MDSCDSHSRSTYNGGTGSDYIAYACRYALSDIM